MRKSLTFQNNRVYTILLHAGAWGLIFFFPLLIADFGDDKERYFRFVKRSILNLSTHLVVFYINYAWLTRNVLFSKKLLQYVGYNLLLITVVVIASRFLYEWFIVSAAAEPTHKAKFPKEIFYFWDVLSYLTNVGVTIALLATNRLAEEEQKVKNSENERLKSELIYLKYKLQPHFFFNTLNNIYALIDAFPEKAKETILKLGKLMRYVLYISDEKNVPLSDEIEFLKNYTELMRIRYAGHVAIKADFMPSLTSAKIPPLLLIPIIENAFKHGVDAIKPSFINILLKETEDSIELNVSNSYFPKTVEDESGSGIGLDNLQKRLDLLLGQGQYVFKQEIKGDIFESQLSIKHQHG